jgi:hypothetical protein
VSVLLNADATAIDLTHPQLKQVDRPPGHDALLLHRLPQSLERLHGLESARHHRHRVLTHSCLHRIFSFKMLSLHQDAFPSGKDLPFSFVLDQFLIQNLSRYRLFDGCVH